MRIAVVTGASAGLGREYVRAIAKRRPAIEEIWVIARRGERLEELRKELGGKIVPVPLDLTDAVCIGEYGRRLKEKNAEVVLLVNSAGFGKLGNFDELSPGDNADMVRLNCEALTLVSAVTLPHMPEGAEIINASSIAAFAPNSRMAVYCSTKAYVLSLSRCMRAELKRRRINVLAVCPGPMDTEFLPIAKIEPGVSRTFDTLPRVNPAVMAEKSLIASRKGRAVYTNRLFFKFYRIVAKLLPHALVMKLAAT